MDYSIFSSSASGASFSIMVIYLGMWAMRIVEYEKRLRRKLTEAQVDNPQLCARLLVAHAAGLNKIEYILAWDQPLTLAQANFLEEMGNRRAKGEPLAYILGKKEFYGREFRVNKHTLTPRPETELLVEMALRLLPMDSSLFADLGCGCGCIGLSLMSERPAWKGILVDNNPDTLQVAQKNSRNLGLDPLLIRGDIFSAPFNNCIFDLIISNPPYIAIEDKKSVMSESLAFEPHCALFSPEGGMAHMKAVIEHSMVSLKAGGWLIVEHGSGQKEMILTMLKSASFINIGDQNDLAGLPRCAYAQKKGV